MKRIKKLIAAGLILSTVLSSLPMQSLTVRAAANENLALNKEATASSCYPGRSWTADKAVDGIIDNTTTKNSRWSSKRATGAGSNEDGGEYGTKEQWLTVDLGEETTVSQINIFWEGAFATKYKLQYSLDGTEFTDIQECTAASAGMVKHNGFEPVTARYIRVYCMEAKNANWGYSVFEVEAYGEDVLENADDVIGKVEGIAPTLSADGKSIVLPEVPAGFEIELFGTDNKQVIDMNGNIIQPLVDMKVNVTYKVTKTGDPDNTAVSAKDASIVIEGKTTPEVNDNEKPNVLPGLREWKGSTGEFALTDSSKIVYAEEGSKDAALMIQTYFRDMLERTVEVEQGTPKAGDIYLVNGETEATVGTEGYVLEIADYVTITAPTYQGMIYGGTSITQILYQDDDRVNAPKGTARDYPKYGVRAGMLDVGRVYIPIEYLEEMATYMSWFKLNEIQVHINDYWGASGYSAFRVESKEHPLINAKDGYYTQDEYRDFQKNVKKYGIDVITEIDTPYHSEAFRPYVESGEVVMNGSGSLDITTEENFNINARFIESLIDEFVDGEDPVIQSDKFHIGTDEYNKAYGEQMRKWTDHFINYVNAKGKETRLWGSLGSRGFNGTTPVSNKATVNLWAAYWSEVQETFDAGFDIINTEGGWLYIVPGGNAGYPDRYDTKKLYERFEVNNFASDRSGNGKIMPVAHPQTKGASFAVWNDMTSFRTGFSWFDIYDRFKEAVTLVAEKTWFGEDQEDQSYAQFRQRVDAVQNKVPNANPGRFVESKTDTIADYDFAAAGNVLKDKSENHYDAELENAVVKDGKLTFDGTGYASLPMKSVGYPYTVMMDVNLSEITEETTLFAGGDGAFYADVDGKLGYRRGDYAFTFDYQLPLNENVKLTLSCDQKNTSLSVNGRYIGTGKLTNKTIGGKAQVSSTFVLPVEKVFENAKGSLSEFKIYNRNLAREEIDKTYISRDAFIVTSDNENPLAGSEGPVRLAFDDNTNTFWHSNYTPKQELPATVEIDMSKAYVVNKFEYLPRQYGSNGHITSYDLYGKLNEGDEYQLLSSGTWEETADLKTAEFEAQEVRYLKFVAKAGKGGFASAAEFYVYQVPGSSDEKPVNLALNKEATASALEVNDGRFTADKAVDGIVSKESRVSFAKADEQWLLVDLGAEEVFDEVVINYESAVGKYEIQVSSDGENFETVYTRNEAPVVGTTPRVDRIKFAPVSARYVKYVQKERWTHTNGQKYSGSIYEFEVYAPVDQERVYEVKVDGQVVETGKYNTKVVLTAEPRDGKKFVGWMVNDRFVSSDETYVFYLAGDIELTKVYADADDPAVAEIEPEAVLSDAFAMDHATDPAKINARFVGQLVVPEGCTIKNAGLVWSSNDTTELVLGGNAKTTYISRISNTNQFSVTIKGMPQGRYICGKIFATITDAEGNETVVYSEMGRVSAK